ncbi:prefoldin domain-containing protein, partial [Nonomuraea sp. NPDC050680]|uniref:prefoldin domain-containing protein n=1 Tax=Nonomuraea sp. NPDC050680 TaxID=3154630 RepID=UPI00340FC5EC
MTRPAAQDPDPGTWLLNKIDARERALTGQIEQTQAEIDAMAAHLGELHEAIEHLRITRKTLLSLADEPGAEPALPPP